MRIAIIGLGSIGSRHVDNLLAIGHTDLIGYDIKPNVNEERLPVLDSENDLWEYEPTHVLVCTPPDTHFSFARRALIAKAHVFVEKPMTATRNEAVLLVEESFIANRQLAVGYMERAHHTPQFIKKLVGEWPLRGIEIKCYWLRTEKTYEQSDLLAESSHALDLALWIGGLCTAVLNIEHHEHGRRAIIQLRQERSPLTTIDICDNIPPGLRYLSAYRIDGGDLVVGANLTYGLKAEEWDICYRDELQAFLDGKPLCTGRDGLAVMELLEQLK